MNTNSDITVPDSIKSKKLVPHKYIWPFVLVTSLFALWGFANDITNPLVAAFGRVMEISSSKAALVQLAFYGGYFTMALPAALFIRKYNYKTAILIGLGLYAAGALMFYPAASYGIFAFFLVSLYILTFGLAFLETTANPFILVMGSMETATRRLNLAQSFNPLGSITGMLIAKEFILGRLHAGENFSVLPEMEKVSIRAHDLMVIRDPYIVLGFVVLTMFIMIAFYKMPTFKDTAKKISLKASINLLFKNKRYVEGVIAQVFYVAAQIMCWTFIIQYANNIGMSYEDAQFYNMIAMSIFIISRFVSTFLMKYFNPGSLLLIFAIGGALTSLGTIFIVGYAGLICLVATSAFMSLMFPTIYGISLRGMGDEAKIGAAGLVMAIVGGALMPPLQGRILDIGGKGFSDVKILSVPEVNFSFILPLFCFIVIAIFGFRTIKEKTVQI
jgi:FHS family L-fucose permease-like MFS transporter